MAQVNTLNTLIQLRRGTQAQWDAVKSTFIPAAGEPCVTLDGENKGQLKIGDGVSTWESLKYAGVANAGNVSVDGKALIIVDGTITLDGLDTATPGQTFKLNADGTGLEWFTPVSETDFNDTVKSIRDELATKVSVNVDDSQEILEIVKGSASA